MVSLVRNQGNYWTEQKNKVEFDGNTLKYFKTVLE